MGMVFGKVTVEEPAYDVLLSRTSNLRPVETSYELRRYGERFAVEADYPDGDSDNDNSPFSLLARYIGVFGTPENEGNESISMTAPVAIQSRGGTAIAMTAPVVRTQDGAKKTMQFTLPKEYNELSKIPKPTNPAVHIMELPPAVGAVHRYSGTFSERRSQGVATGLAQQLREDGIDLSEAQAMDTYQFWGYNPPFTIPIFRRNEVWIPLTEEQASILVNTFDPSATN